MSDKGSRGAGTWALAGKLAAVRRRMVTAARRRAGDPTVADPPAGMASRTGCSADGATAAAPPADGPDRPSDDWVATGGGANQAAPWAISETECCDSRVARRVRTSVARANIR